MPMRDFFIQGVQTARSLRGNYAAGLQSQAFIVQQHFHDHFI
jgi:hypothetical protein